MSLIPFILMTLFMIDGIICRVMPLNNNIIGESTDSYDYSDYHRNYQDNPMMLKRTALMLDRMILQRAINNQKLNNEESDEDIINDTKSQIKNINTDEILSHNSQSRVMDLHRQGRANRSFYWRCYFNVVTCFKKK